MLRAKCLACNIGYRLLAFVSLYITCCRNSFLAPIPMGSLMTSSSQTRVYFQSTLLTGWPISLASQPFQAEYLRRRLDPHWCVSAGQPHRSCFFKFPLAIASVFFVLCTVPYELEGEEWNAVRFGRRRSDISEYSVPRPACVLLHSRQDASALIPARSFEWCSKGYPSTEWSLNMAI